jgi:hypothetical protein
MVVVFDLVSLYGTTSMLSKDEKVAIVAAVASIGLSDFATALASHLEVSAPKSGRVSLLSSARFQLRHMGPWMERATASRSLSTTR